MALTNEQVETYGDAAQQAAALIAMLAANAKKNKAAKEKAELDKKLAIEKNKADIANSKQAEKNKFEVDKIKAKIQPLAATPPAPPKEGMSTGTIALIAIVGIAVLGGVGYMFYIKNKK